MRNVALANRRRALTAVTPSALYSKRHRDATNTDTNQTRTTLTGRYYIYVARAFTGDPATDSIADIASVNIDVTDAVLDRVLVGASGSDGRRG